MRGMLRLSGSATKVERFIARGSAAPSLQEVADTFAFPLDRFQEQAIAAFLKGAPHRCAEVGVIEP